MQLIGVEKVDVTTKWSFLAYLMVGKDNGQPINVEGQEMQLAGSVLLSKLRKTNLIDRFTDKAFLALEIISENNPGFIQILALECLQGHDGKVTMEHILHIYDDVLPMHADYEPVWRKQKWQRGNMVDHPYLWHLVGNEHLTYDKAVEDFLVGVKDYDTNRKTS